MKKNLFFAFMFLLGGMLLTACSNPDNPGGGGQSGPSDLETYFFSVVDATYEPGAFPEATIPETIEGLYLNEHAIAGGMGQIEVTTTKTYTKFFIGAEGAPGYFQFIPTPVGEGGEGGGGLTGNDIYKIALMYSTLLTDNIVVLIAAEDENGDITTAIRITIIFEWTHVTTDGDINVNLFFSNEKDVDLYLVMPDGTTIYYGNRGGTYVNEEGETVAWGLDLDSNPGCNIDGIKNENIFIPAVLVQNGEYTVKVDMYSNCDPSIATDWYIQARYQGELVTNVIDNELYAGKNPVSGTYPVGAPNRDMTPVLKFIVTGA